MVKTFSLRPSESQCNFEIEYEKLLNKEQLEAVKNFHGPMLCIAGAGSGKTRTLIYRVARMIESGIDPESILLLTFTRKAAKGMLNKVAALIGEKGQKVAGGTYHSFANQILRRYGHFIGLPASFSIMDEADSCDVINFIRAELELNKKETRFPKKKTIFQIYSKSINLELSVQNVIEEFYSHFVDHTDDIKKIIQRYSDYKKENFLVDYDDLLVLLHQLLTTIPEAKERICSKYKYIMADEYQDTNGLQAKITFELGGEKKNIMVVGDDSQSIYSFRGARVKNILEFPENFANCTIIKLERNYRSVNTILTSANSLMKKAREGYEKNLFTTKEGGEKPGKVRCEDDQEQAMLIASRILDLREEGIPLNEIAVLFRSGFHSFQLELELKRRNIPFVKWGGYKFLESTHLKDILAHLRIFQNPYDQVSWLRVLLLIEGIGTQTATGLFKKIKEAENPFDLEKLDLPPKLKERLKNLTALLKSLSKIESPPPSRCLDMITEYYFPILKKNHDNYPKRLKDIDQLAIIAGKFNSLAEFLSELSLEPPRDSVDGVLTAKDQNDDESMVLSTIHSSKGLEWHSVFIIWALEGRFPSFAAMGSDQELEEERRLMYVAMTRAKENLLITYPGSFFDPISSGLLSRPSRFLEEIGEENLEKWEISR